jgi:3-hydroxyisobutyrate dehydrogenase
MMGHVVIVGIGNMGSAIAERLLSRGHRVTVYNRTRDTCLPLEAKGARIADDLSNALTDSQVVISVLYD